MTKRLLAGLCAVSFMLVLVGCNTMEGLGRDVSKLGNKIETKADEKGY